MAEIKQYSPQITPDSAIPGRSPERLEAEPGDFGGGAGLIRIGQGLDQGADVLNEMAAKQEVSDVYVKQAQLRSQWSTALQQKYASSQPGDPDFVQSFMHDFNGAASSAGDGYVTTAGQQAWQRGQAELTGHFLDTSTTLAIHSAGVAAKQNYLTAVDNWGSSLVTNPAQFDSVMKDATTALNDPNGPYAQMGPDAKAELSRQTNEKLALAAVEGSARIDPKGTLDALNDGAYSKYLSAPATNMMIQRSQTNIQAGLIQEQRNMMLQLKQAQQTSEATESSIIKDAFSDSPKLTAQDVANMPDAIAQPGQPNGLTSASKLTMLALLQRQNKPDTAAQVSATNSQDLFTRMILPDGDPNKITSKTQLNQAYAQGDLTRTDLDWLGKKFDDNAGDGGKLVSTEHTFLSTIKPGMVSVGLPGGGGLGTSTRAELKYFDYMRYVDDQVTSYQKAGKNPMDLFDSRKPDYVGAENVIRNFRVPISERLADVTASLGGKPAAPGVPASPAAPQGMPSPATLEERDKLPSGTKYKDPDGVVRVKK